MSSVSPIFKPEYMADISRQLHGGGEPPYDADMEARLRSIENILPTLATKLDIAEVKTEIQKGINSTERWMIATVIGLFIGFGGLFMAMSNALKPSAPAASQAQQAPIIINVPVPAPVASPAPSGKQ